MRGGEGKADAVVRATGVGDVGSPGQIHGYLRKSEVKRNQRSGNVSDGDLMVQLRVGEGS